MRQVLEALGDGYQWYQVRRPQYDNGQSMPFLVSPTPFYLSAKQGQQVLRIGQDVTDFMQAADELYRTKDEVKNLLDRGKPEIFQKSPQTWYLFARPDLLITAEGFAICEIETSPFGLALAELLNRGYRFAGFDTIVGNGVLSEFMTNNTPNQGTVVFSAKTAAYSGQLQFLAREVMSKKGRQWEAQPADIAINQRPSTIYRGFYPYEYAEDLFVNRLIEDATGGNNPVVMIPSLTPHMEEKALLTLIWDQRWEPFFKKQLGVACFEHLREVVPPTWVVGQEQFFVLGLPMGISSSEGLAGLSRSKRQFVLKKSGFGNGSSWAEGVFFLQDKSAAKTNDLLAGAQADNSSLYIIQEFKKSVDQSLLYKNGNGVLGHMSRGRVRLTPYFSLARRSQGQLVAVKATACENTDYIHASTSSINTAVATI